MKDLKVVPLAPLAPLAPLLLWDLHLDIIDIIEKKQVILCSMMKKVKCLKELEKTQEYCVVSISDVQYVPIKTKTI